MFCVHLKSTSGHSRVPRSATLGKDSGMGPTTSVTGGTVPSSGGPFGKRSVGVVSSGTRGTAGPTSISFN